MGVIAGAAGVVAIFWVLGIANAIAAVVAWTGRMDAIDEAVLATEANVA
jgi:hypothetical protein